MFETNYVVPFDSKISNDIYRFQINPKRYQLKLSPDFQKTELTFDGEVSIDFEITAPKPVLKLHAKSLEIIGNIILKNGDQVYKSNDYKFETEHTENFLTINFDRELTKGDYNLYIKFKSQSNYKSKSLKHAFYVDASGKKEWILLSNFKANGIHEVFPCWNDDLSRSKFDVSIKHNKAYTVLFNSSPKQVKPDEGDPNLLWTTFEETIAFTSSCFAFIIGNLELMSAQNNDPFRLWFPKNTIDCENSDIKIIDKLWKALENVTGVTHKEHSFNKLDVVVLPEFLETKTLNWGLCTINDVSIGFKENIDKTVKVKVITEIAASMIDHWFGELMVNVDYGRGTDFSYGLRVYLSELIGDKVDKTWRCIDRFINRQGQEGNWNEFHNNYLSRTVHHALGDENFRKALRNYIINNGPKDTIISPLLDEIANAAEDNKELMEKVLKNWQRFSSFPTLTVTRNYEANKAIVTQARFLSDPESNWRYWVPLNWANDQEFGFEDTSVTQWYDGDFMKTEIPVTVSADSWIIVNKQHFGTYRVTYDKRNWELIIKYLNSDNYSKIHVFNRIQLINDAFTIADWEFLDYSVPFELAKYLTRETEFTPWTAFLHYIEQLYNESPLRDSPYFDNFKKYVLELTDDLEKRILLTDDVKDDFITRFLRIPLISVRCIFGSSACGNYALTKLKNWLEDPEKHPISADMKEVILMSGIRFSDEETWNKLFERYELNLQTPENKKIDMYVMLDRETNKEEIILNALSCTPSFELLKKFIILVPTKVPGDINVTPWFKNIAKLNKHGVDAILDVMDSKPTKENGDLLFPSGAVYEACSAVLDRLRTDDQLQKFNRVKLQYLSDSFHSRFDFVTEGVSEKSMSKIKNKLEAFKKYFETTD